ncbi:MAG: hypothetical protein WCB92_02350 [Mycobacterium sp.]
MTIAKMEIPRATVFALVSAAGAAYSSAKTEQTPFPALTGRRRQAGQLTTMSRDLGLSMQIY